MASRYQKFSKALANKLSNLELDIARLEQEIGPDTDTNTPEYMTRLLSKVSTTLDEQTDINSKVADCEVHLEACKRRRQAFYAELEVSKSSELEIYSGELERIAFVYNDWVNTQLDRKCELECQLANLESNIAETECQIKCAQETVAGFKTVKRDIRATMLDNLLQHQRELKVNKKHYEAYTADLANIEREILDTESWIAGYDGQRYLINVEYYDWLDKITKLRDSTPASQDLEQQIQHQQAIIKLEADPRQHFKTRFIELDSQLYETQRRLKRLRTHASKLARSNFLERPIMKLDQIRASGPEQISILCEHTLAKQDIQELTNLLEILKCNKQVILAELEPLLAELSRITAGTASSESVANPAFWLPDDINIFRVRIEERRAISSERHIASESSFIQAIVQEETDTRTNLNQLRATIGNISGQLMRQDIINEQVNAISLRQDKKELLARLRVEYVELDNQLKQSAG